MLRQSRHGYAAGLPRGLPTGIRNRLRSRPPTRGGRALLTGPYPPGSSRRRDYGAFPTGSNCVYTFPSRLPDPDRLAVPTRPGVVGAAPTLTCVPRLGLPPASKACCDRPTVESFHLHPVHGASWRTRTTQPNAVDIGGEPAPDRYHRVRWAACAPLRSQHVLLAGCCCASPWRGKPRAGRAGSARCHEFRAMSADHFHAVGPGEGEAIWFLQTLMSVKASGAESGGAFSLIEVHYPPAFSPPRHIHHHEDESFYVLDGEVTFICGDRTWRTQQGAFVVLPAGSSTGSRSAQRRQRGCCRCRRPPGWNGSSATPVGRPHRRVFLRLALPT